MNTYFRYNLTSNKMEKILGKKALKYDLVLENNDRILKYNIQGLRWNISLDDAQIEADNYISERIKELRNALELEIAVYKTIYKQTPIVVGE